MLSNDDIMLVHYLPKATTNASAPNVSNYNKMGEGELYGASASIDYLIEFLGLLGLFGSFIRLSVLLCAHVVC